MGLELGSGVVKAMVPFQAGPRSKATPDMAVFQNTYNKDYSILGSFWGVPYFGSYSAYAKTEWFQGYGTWNSRCRSGKYKQNRLLGHQSYRRIARE